MPNHKLRWLIVAVLIVFAMDWVLGVLIVQEVLPGWVFLAANFPFGEAFLWFESHWTGKQYVIDGRAVSESWAFVIFAVVVLLQATLYVFLANLLNRRRRRQRHGREAAGTVKVPRERVHCSQAHG